MKLLRKIGNYYVKRKDLLLVIEEVAEHINRMTNSESSLRNVVWDLRNSILNNRMIDIMRMERIEERIERIERRLGK